MKKIVLVMILMILVVLIAGMFVLAFDSGLDCIYGLEITGVHTYGVSMSRATVCWETDEPATSQLEYGENSDCNFRTTPNETLEMIHRVELTDLKPETIYYVKVKSRNAFEHEAVSDIHVFNTTSCEDSSDTAAYALPLSEIKYWAYQIQDISENSAVETLANSHYDMLVLEPTRTDWSSDDKYFDTKGMVERLKNTKNSDGVHRKLITAYIDIGEAENWRWYWNWSKEWPRGEPRPADWPDYILTHDPDDWEGCFPVAYWDERWKDIVIYGRNQNGSPYGDYNSIIDEVIKDDFDGIYLDWVEGYENDAAITEAQRQGKDPAIEMIQFIREMHDYATERNPEFAVIQQNAAALCEGHPELFSVIDAISQEAVWYDGEAFDDWDASDGYDVPNDSSLVDYYLEYLDQYAATDIPVFNCEYALHYADEAYNKSHNKGYVPYCTRRALSRLTTTPPPGYALNRYTYEITILESSYHINIETDGTLESFTYTNYTFSVSWRDLGSYENITLPKSLNNTRIQVMLYYMVQGLVFPEIAKNMTHYLVSSPETGQDARITKVAFGEPRLDLTLSTSTTYIDFQVNITGKATYRNTPLSGTGVNITYGFYMTNITVPGFENFIAYANTASDGKFSTIWKPASTGSFVVAAVIAPNPWEVDEAYPATSVDYAHVGVTSLAEQYVFCVVSNSTISSLVFNSTANELSFTASGPSGTTGYARIFISKELVANISELKVYVDETQVDYVATLTDDSWLLNLLYEHSPHDIVVIIPEFPSTIILLTASVFTALVVIIEKKSRKKRI